MERPLTPRDSEPETDHVGDEKQARREFLKKIGKSSATVPAAVLLLSASTKQAQILAAGGSGCATTSGGSGSS